MTGFRIDVFALVANGIDSANREQACVMAKLMFNEAARLKDAFNELTFGVDCFLRANRDKLVPTQAEYLDDKWRKALQALDLKEPPK